MIKTIWNYIWFAYARTMCLFNKHFWMDYYEPNNKQYAMCVICNKEKEINKSF